MKIFLLVVFGWGILFLILMTFLAGAKKLREDVDEYKQDYESNLED